MERTKEKMTRITYIRGIGADEHSDRAANVKQDGYIPFNALTMGEAKLHLLNRRLELLKGFYPELKIEIQKNQNLIYQILRSGLHQNGRAASGGYPIVINTIRKAARKRTAANGGRLLIPKNKKIGLGEVVPIRDCSQFLAVYDDGYGNYSETQLPGYDDCIYAQSFERSFNAYIIKGAHHVLYEFLDRAKHLDTPYPYDGKKVTPASAGFIAGKQALHRTAVTSIANIAGFSRELLHDWYDTAMMERNVQVKLPPKNGFATVNLLKSGAFVKNQKNLSKINGIGIAPAVLTALLIEVGKVLVALAGAIAATAGLVTVLKQNPKQGQLNAFATREFSADTLDWDGDGIPNEIDPTPNSENNNNALLLAAGAGLLLLSIK